MIIITHHKDRVVKIESEAVSVAGEEGFKLTATILKLAKDHPDTLLVWVDKEYRDVLNIDYFRNYKESKNTLQSFSPVDNYMPRDIGYVEETLFVNVNKAVKYPTWLMSATVGCANSLIFNSIKSSLPANTSFDYYLNAIAKQAMPQGLLCYSNPVLLTTTEILSASKKELSTKQFFEFIRQHYKKRWLFLVSLQHLIFESRFTFFHAIVVLFKSKHKAIYHLSKPVLSTLDNTQSVDVIIPTMGRKEYLLDVLKDLQNQSQQPTCIIIVEQNPDEYSKSQLDYLQNERWPFEIKHTFIHQTGACNARNVALAQVQSDWVFFADDDIRLEKNAIEDALALAQLYKMDAVTMSCLQKDENEKVLQPIQWLGFGSGTSIVKSAAIGDKKFDLAYEHGHGEDGDFGMQLRTNGTDILYAPHIQLLHIKAPIGGFRIKTIKEWEQDIIIPKPSPTVMRYKLKYLTQTQLKSYKFLLFTKHYFGQSVKNPFTYFNKIKKAWASSIAWAHKLEQRHG